MGLASNHDTTLRPQRLTVGQLLGRAKEISEFVKHGSDKGWIEIILSNKNGPNVVIKRHINKNNNTSVWKINGKNTRLQLSESTATFS